MTRAVLAERLEVVDPLPKTPTGKIRKIELKERFSWPTGGSAVTSTTEHVQLNPAPIPTSITRSPGPACPVSTSRARPVSWSPAPTCPVRRPQSQVLAARSRPSGSR